LVGWLVVGHHQLDELCAINHGLRMLGKEKSVNLQYNMLGLLDDGKNESSTERLMFRVLFFFHDILQNSLQKSYYFLFVL
jgi:hypothetical protein